MRLRRGEVVLSLVLMLLPCLGRSQEIWEAEMPRPAPGYEDQRAQNGRLLFRLGEGRSPYPGHGFLVTQAQTFQIAMQKMKASD